MGSIKRKALSAEEKAKLIIWLSSNRDLCEKVPCTKLAELFYEDAGVKVVARSVYTYMRAVYPEFVAERIPGGEANGGKIAARVKSIENRIAHLESLAGIFQ